jgi:hypothetical protein
MPRARPPESNRMAVWKSQHHAGSHARARGTQDDRVVAASESHRVRRRLSERGRQHGQRHGIAVVGGHPVEVGDGRGHCAHRGVTREV